jgi:hypothetical protein
MWNAGPLPARMIEIINPAGFENYFVDPCGGRRSQRRAA